MTHSSPPLLTGTVAALGIRLAGRYTFGVYFLSYASTSLQQENGESRITQSHVTDFIIRAAPKKN